MRVAVGAVGNPTVPAQQLIPATRLADTWFLLLPRLLRYGATHRTGSGTWQFCLSRRPARSARRARHVLFRRGRRHDRLPVNPLQSARRVAKHLDMHAF
jgi:hypothetical protein